MPNPYHDETGRFCSKEEMGAAVKRLEAALIDAPAKLGGLEQAVNSYFELRREYEALNRGVVEMPEEWVAQVASSGLHEGASLPNTPEGIEAIYRSGLEYKLREPNDRQAIRGANLLASEITPTWIKDDIYRSASAQAKAAMIRHLSASGNYDGVTSEELLPFTWGDNGHQEGVTHALLESNRIGFDVKYQLAKERGNLAFLVAQNLRAEQSLFQRIPDLEADLKLEARNPLRPEKNRLSAKRVLARNTADANLRTQLLADERATAVDNRSILSHLATNPHLSEGEGLILLERAARTDAIHFDRLYENLSTSRANRSTIFNAPYGSLLRRLAPGTKAYTGVSPEREQDALAAVSGYDYLLSEGSHRFPTLPRDSQELAVKVLGEDRTANLWQELAVLDAQPQRFNELEVDLRRAEKDAVRAARQGNRDAHSRYLLIASERSARLTRARKLREAHLILQHLQAEYTASTPA